MTTAAQTPPSDAIPPWFMESANENTRQHAELASQIADAKLETANLRTEMIEKLGALEAQTTAQIGALRTEVHREIASLLRWVVGTTAGMGVAVVGSLIYAVERLA